MTTGKYTKHQFKKFVARGVTLVEFNAPWCRPCRRQVSITKALRRLFSGAARVEIFDIDQYKETAIRLGIQSIPTIIIYKDGREMERFIGLQTGDILKKALDGLVN